MDIGFAEMGLSLSDVEGKKKTPRVESSSALAEANPSLLAKMQQAWGGLQESVYSKLNRKTLEAAQKKQQNGGGLMSFEDHAVISSEQQQILEKEYVEALPTDTQEGLANIDQGLQKAEKTARFLAMWGKTTEFFKDRPEMLGSITGIGLAAIGAFTQDAEIAMRLNEASVVIGVASAAAGQGGSGRQKLAFAAMGAAAGIGMAPYVDQGISHATAAVQSVGLPTEATAGIVMGLHGVDDAIGASAPFAIEGVKKIARKKAQPKVRTTPLKTKS